MITITTHRHVVLRASSETINTPCQWVDFCPDGTCRKCPAHNVEEEMSFSDAVEWWEAQE